MNDYEIDISTPEGRSEAWSKAAECIEAAWEGTPPDGVQLARMALGYLRMPEHELLAKVARDGDLVLRWSQFFLHMTLAIMADGEAAPGFTCQELREEMEKLN